LVVSDSGRGISPEFLQGHLFTPFIQEEASNPGTGLGMSIVKKILSSLGGTIDITSTKGVGTEMVVSVTLNQVPLSAQRPLKIKYEHPAFGARKMTSGLTIGLIGFENSPETTITNAGELNSKALALLKLSIRKMVKSWFGMKVTKQSTWLTSPPDIYIANEYVTIISPLLRICSLTENRTPSQLAAREIITSSGTPIIVFCSNAYRTYAARRIENRVGLGIVHCVSKP
jgi:hypothetical protein